MANPISDEVMEDGMTLKDAIRKKKDACDKTMEKELNDRANLMVVKSRMKGIKWKVCDRIDCDSCPVFHRFSDFGHDMSYCMAKEGDVDDMLHAVEVLERWIAEYEATTAKVKKGKVNG